MEIRKATLDDVDEIMAVFARARAFMESQGNPQWSDGYLTEELVREDIEKTYVCMEGERIACVFYFAVERDPDYGEINGSWVNEEPYAVVHRVASAGIVKGAAKYCLDWAYEQFPNIRIDTFIQNQPMQALLKKCGFLYCGDFERIGIAGWLAYQKPPKT